MLQLGQRLDVLQAGVRDTCVFHVQPPECGQPLETFQLVSVAPVSFRLIP